MLDSPDWALTVAVVRARVYQTVRRGHYREDVVQDVLLGLVARYRLRGVWPTRALIRALIAESCRACARR